MCASRGNVGFVRNCNAAWARCRGEYVLLLNNDARVLPGAIDRMLAALEADATLAAVGPKLVYPNGRLQEAGCFIRPNGEGAMVGLFGDPKGRVLPRPRRDLLLRRRADAAPRAGGRRAVR